MELGQAVSRPSPKKFGLVHVEFQSVGGQPVESSQRVRIAVELQS